MADQNKYILNNSAVAQLTSLIDEIKSGAIVISVNETVDTNERVEFSIVYFPSDSKKEVKTQ